MLLLTGAALLAYALGSLSGSLLLGRVRGVDIRAAGSGNAGGTNALRTQGWRFALGVVVIDIGKGSLAAWIGLHLHAAAPAPLDIASAQGALCAVAAIVGHCWPLFFGFRGGKGAATAIGAVLVLAPLLAVPVVAAWTLVLIATGYVGLATVLAGVTLAASSLALPALQAGGAAPLIAFAWLTALLIVFTHRANLARLARGTEYRFDKARLLRRRSRHLQRVVVLGACLAAAHGHAEDVDAQRAVTDAVQRIRIEAAGHRLILLGELHGTQEIPGLIGALAAAYALREHVTLGLEIFQTESEPLQRYLASDGGPQARNTLLASEFWTPRDSRNDGRRSYAMLDLIERIRREKAAGRHIDVLPYDNPRLPWVDSATRDRAMAVRLRNAFMAMPRGRLLVLSGNVHAMHRRPADAPAEMQVPMGAYLRDLQPYSIDITAAGGETWRCLQQCGPVAMSANYHPATGRVDDGTYDFQIALPRFSVARMIGEPAQSGVRR